MTNHRLWHAGTLGQRIGAAVAVKESARGLEVSTLQAPPLLKLVFGGLRGYAGDVSPPAALDLVSTRGNTFIIDLRSARYVGKDSF